MRILFDQATPVPLKSYLVGHEVRTAAEQSWDRLKNGDLISAAEDDGFEPLLTTDKIMPHQQNMAGRRIALMILSRQQWPQLRPHVDLVVKALGTVVPGTCILVEIPEE